MYSNKLENQPKVAPYLFLAGAFVLGAFIRLYAAWQAGFPMVDGGMFLSMARDLQASHYLLPPVTSYNHLQIPFAYPPLGFYLLAGLNTLTGFSLPALLQWLPAIFSALTILPFFLLARRILGSDPRAALATAIYTLTPQAFEWQVMGGGLTRSLGALFAILAVFFALRMFQEKSSRMMAAAILTGALTVYSHPEWALQALTACILGWIFFGRNKSGVLHALGTGFGVLVLSAPWWLGVALQDGLGIFQLASQTPQGRLLFWWPLLSMSFAASTNILVVGLGLIGVFLCLKTKKYFLPAWVLASFLVDLRSAGHVVSLQLALLATIAFSDLLLPWFKPSPTPAESVPRPNMALPSRLAQLFLAYLFVAMLVNSFFSASNLARANTLPVADRQAMDWVRENTAFESRFVVLGWVDSPWVSPLTEWFPARSERTSLTTVQGREWLAGNENVTPWLKTFEDIQSCLYQTIACLEDWSAAHAEPYDYVYLSLHDPADPVNTVRLNSLYLSLNDSQNYSLIYDAPMVKVFQHTH